MLIDAEKPVYGRRNKVEKEKEAVAEIQKIMDTTNQKISLIEKRFEANRELWVRELFDKIIGGD